MQTPLVPVDQYASMTAILPPEFSLARVPSTQPCNCLSWSSLATVGLRCCPTDKLAPGNDRNGHDALLHQRLQQTGLTSNPALYFSNLIARNLIVYYNCVMPEKFSVSTATSNPALLLDNQLCFSLYSASLAMTKLYKPLLDALNLTYPQYLVLLVLWESDDLGVGALGERLNLDSGTLTPLLKRMETAGLLVRQRSREDERRVHIKLSAAGKELQARVAHIPGCVMAQSGLRLKEMNALKQQLQQLRAAINAPTTQASA